MNLQQAMADLIEQAARRTAQGPQRGRRCCAQLTHEPIEIVHLIYRDKPYELESKDYEFSRASVDEHWEAGLRDICNTLDASGVAAGAPRRPTA